MVESPLLADSSSDCSYQLSHSFGPLSRNEIGLSARALILCSSRGISPSLTLSSELGLELGVGVASKAVNVEARATFWDGEEPAFEGKQHTHRERERDGHKEYVPIEGVQQLYNDNNLF